MKTVCIIHPNKNAYSETFIRAHIERLPAKVRVLYGGFFPRYREDDRPLLAAPGLLTRMGWSFQRRVMGVPADHFQKQALRRFLAENGVEAVLAEYGPTGVEVMDVCQEAGVPLTVNFLGFDAYHRDTLRDYGPRYGTLFETARAVVAVSKAMMVQLGERGCPPGKLHYNPCGADVKRYVGADPAAAGPVFLFVGRFADTKAPHLGLLAFAEVLKSCPPASLRMVGDGPLLEACRQMVRAMGLESAVSFLGVLRPDQLLLEMRKARALIQHSVTTEYGDSEGTPVIILEAGAAGLPVVCTRHAGIRDVVVEGETGFLVEERDIRGMASAMVRFVREPELAGKMGAAARARIAARFSIEQCISNLWRILETGRGQAMPDGPEAPEDGRGKT